MNDEEMRELAWIRTMEAMNNRQEIVVNPWLRGFVVGFILGGGVMWLFGYFLLVH